MDSRGGGWRVNTIFFAFFFSPPPITPRVWGSYSGDPDLDGSVLTSLSHSILLGFSEVVPQASKNTC